MVPIKVSKNLNRPFCFMLSLYLWSVLLVLKHSLKREIKALWFSRIYISLWGKARFILVASNQFLNVTLKVIYLTLSYIRWRQHYLHFFISSVFSRCYGYRKQARYWVAAIIFRNIVVSVYQTRRQDGIKLTLSLLRIVWKIVSQYLSAEKVTESYKLKWVKLSK